MKYAAFLRGIMPGNPNMRNEVLRALFEKLGFLNVKTVISSGNVLFETKNTHSKSSKKLEAEIESALLKELGLNTTTIIRSKAQLDKLIKADPFAKVTESKSEKPNLTFFKIPPEESQLPKNGKGFKGYGFISGAYCYTVDMKTIKTPEAMLTLEKHFGKGITTRTWNTVVRVHRILGE